MCFKAQLGVFVELERRFVRESRHRDISLLCRPYSTYMLPTDAYSDTVTLAAFVYRPRGVNNSLVPRPQPQKKGKGLVTFLAFLGCADSAVIYMMVPYEKVLVDVRIADSAQPIKASNCHQTLSRFMGGVWLVPRPRPQSEGKGLGTIERFPGCAESSLPSACAEKPVFI